MKKQLVSKFLLQYKWLLLLLLGASLGTIALLTTRHTSPTPTSTSLSSPTPTSTTPTPLISPTSPTTSTSTPPTPTPPRSTPPTPPRTLTPEQEALNQRNKQAFEAANSSIDSLIDMRVAIAEGVSSAAVRTSTAAAVIDESGKVLQTLSANVTYTANPGEQSIRLNSSRLPKAVMIAPSADGVFYVGDRAYRGKLLLVVDGGRLWAVNFVNLRTYLHSVVGSEVSPSWNMEALKAQAVAARSYALTHYFRPATSVYHLGATERYQVYRGIEREADRTSQAVDATAGEFVSHRGDIVESLYAASDDIVMEAFQGRGMSQLGALNLADRGYTYKQILSNYYPETGVARISEDLE